MKDKIVVMHFVSGLLSGGVEQMLYNYCGFMDKDRYEFIIVYQHEPVPDCLKKIQSISYTTIKITARSENFIKNISESYDLIKRYHPDIVHTHMNLMNFCALIPAKLLGIKVRISHSHIAEKNKNFFYKAMACVCKKINIYAATEFMACGEEAGEYMYGKRRMKKKKILIVNNAIDLDYYKKDNSLREQERRSLGIDNDTLLIGHVGRFSEQKNHLRLLGIFKELNNRNTESKLLLVGTGELDEIIKNRVRELQLEDSVIFYGTTQDMKKVYSAMDIFVLPSLYEGLPVVSVEVQAAEIPAVFSDTVSKECKLTNLVTFLSLEKKDAQWAEVILKKAEKKNKRENLAELYRAYDIREKSKELDQYYMACLKKKGFYK